MKKLILSNPKLFLALGLRAAKWHLQYYSTGRAFPMLAGMYVTNACNFRCASCNIWRNKKKSTVPLQQFKSIIDDLSSLGTFYFSISGGEPLLLPDFAERISYAKSKIPYVHFVSNGFLLDEAKAKQLASTGVDEVSISIDGLEKTHDRLRGVPGAFGHAVAAVKNLKQFAPRVQIVVNSILSPDTIDDLYRVVALTKELGVLHKFQPINDHPVFECQESQSAKWSANQEQLAKVDSFVSFLKTQPHVVNTPYFLSRVSRHFRRSNNDELFSEDCTIPYFFCEFREDGSVSPCLAASDWKNSFSTKNGLKQSLASRAYHEEQKKLEKCRVCQKNMFVCYLEPRMSFPFPSLLKYGLFK